MFENVLKSKWSALVCAALLALFAVTSWCAVGNKSPAYDEPYHAISSWVQLRHFDFRIDDEDPPLWQYWASLLNGPHALKADFTGEIWQSMPTSVVRQWYWGVQILYRTRGNDPDKLIAHCRAMMLIIAITLGAMICLWAWRLGGPAAALIATALFSLDPNFLAHSALMKNDVAFAASMFALAFALWKAGEKLTIARLAWICAFCIVTLTTKFSGIVAVLLVPFLLGLRAVLPTPWPAFGKTISARSNRMLLAGSVTVIAIVTSYLGIWSVYGFRFRPAPDRNVFLNLVQITDEIRINAMIALHDGTPPAGAKVDENLPFPAEMAMFANRHGLLPQAFIGGFLFTYANGIVRFAYANGQISPVGWWWYFPFAILVKTPVATLMAVVICAVIRARNLFRGKPDRDTRIRPVRAASKYKKAPRSDTTGTGRRPLSRHDVPRSWNFICLLFPVGIFLASAMFSNLNIGIRHVLSIYPFLFVGVGVVGAGLWNRGGTKTRGAIVAIGLLLAVETFSAYPNFIAFFNSVATTSSSKLELLGDSNLDWGQDLPKLAQWQRQNPDRKLYLCYFGYADPAHYGITYVPLPGGYHYDPTPHFPDPYEPAVLAISASDLQGFLLDPKLRAYYRKWAVRKPIDVLGDSIYLYEYDPSQQ